jgi:hypothetical protein
LNLWNEFPASKAGPGLIILTFYGNKVAINFVPNSEFDDKGFEEAGEEDAKSAKPGPVEDWPIY